MSAPTTFNQFHPPKNRITNSLGVLDIHIQHSDGVLQLDPNAAAMHAYSRTLPVVGCVAGLQSDITGNPAYRYTTNEVSLNLSLDELYRLLRHDLHRHEVFSLVQKYGVFFEVHSDFYNQDTGAARQPMTD
ncbi:MAG: hypothetical protein Q7S87_03335 [Agitococcus sp.]|nr:hypothetical protein [Agitococcus sp.]MDO9178669.1 hypothetical protein [Agitococcus sp.]